jgi:hypothetical protein
MEEEMLGGWVGIEWMWRSDVCVAAWRELWTIFDERREAKR